MQLSRRRVIAAIGSGASLGLAGCAANGADGGDSDDSEDEEGSPGPTVDAENASTDGEGISGPDGSSEAPSFPTEGPLHARLVGPDREIRLFDRSDIVEVGAVSAQRDHYAVPVTLSEERGDAFLEAVQDLDLEENYGDYEIVMTVDGEEIRRSPIAPGLARVWDTGEWERQFVIQSPAKHEAYRLREALV